MRQSIRKRLELSVENNAGWGQAKPSNIQRLCENIALHFNEQLRDEYKVSGKLTITYLHNNPIAFYRSSFGGGPDEYKIGLSVSKLWWDKFSYQFGHEFCHIMQNHDQLKNCKNGWFHEAICMLASIWVLRQMSKTWAYRAPYPNWGDYRHNLLIYADKELQLPAVQFSGSAAEWLAEHEQFLRDDYKNNFTHHKLVAQFSYQFLHIFESHPEAWNAVRQMPVSNAPLTEYIKEWYDNVDVEDKTAVETIATEIGISVALPRPSR